MIILKKIGAFFEAHVEKIVLIIVGILCSWLLITRVLFSPNAVEYSIGSKTEKLSPSAIDNRIYEDAQNLRDEPTGMFTAPEIRPAQKPVYLATLENPLSDIDINVHLPLPEPANVMIASNEYRRPNIGKITNIDIEHIRAAMYEPVETITVNNPYDSSNSEPNALDLVTVEGQYDLTELYDELWECYVNVDPDKAKPDSELAEPIFASVNLQRKELHEDGSESEWTDIPRLKIDYNKDLFKVVNNVSDLPFLGGFTVYKLRLDNIQTQLELLQPASYQIASAQEEWLPPTFHRDYLKAKDQEEKREREAEKLNNSNTTASTGGRRTNTRNQNTMLNSGTTSTNTGGRRGNTGTGSTRGRGNRNQDPVYTTQVDTYQEGELVNLVYEDFQNIVLKIDDDLKKIDEPITIWAIDDTVEPGKTYKYRMRLGILNQNTSGNDGQDIIFWSDFSNETQPVEIPGMMYFFANSMREAAKTVVVSIYKYVLGYWYKEDFTIAQGEVIGDVVELDLDEDEDTDTRITDDMPESIDFNTGAIMVDVSRAYEWSGLNTLGYKDYYDMLYSKDGIEIMHMPISSKNWPDKLLQDYNEVQPEVNKDKEPLKAWGASELELENIRAGQYQNFVIR